jgi:heme-degrading monooxygenase HmoA
MYMRLLQLKIKEDSIPLIGDFYASRALAELQNTRGCQFASLLQNQTQPEELISLTIWDRLEDAEAYSRSAIFLKIMEEVHPHLADSSEWKVQLSKEMKLTYAPLQEEPRIDSFRVAVQEQLKPGSGPSFIRFFSLTVKEGRLDEFERIYNGKILPALKTTPGCTGAFLIRNLRDPQHLVSLTLWENAMAAEEYETTGLFASLLEKISHTLSEFYQWKLALEKDKAVTMHTSEDGKIDHYHVVLGKRFHNGDSDGGSSEPFLPG